MIYFSELLGKKVFSDTQEYLGRLSDLVFLAEEKPYITKCIIKGAEEFIIPLLHLKHTNGSFVATKPLISVPVEDNELYLQRNILDKQIIDIQGSKVVRVNDILIQNSKKNWYISGVDTSMMSLLRWFKLELPLIRLLRFLSIDYPMDVLSWNDIQPLELARGRLQLRLEQEKLKKVRPEDLADYLEKTNIANTKKILSSMDEEYAADVINSLQLTYQTELFKDFTPPIAARIIGLLDPDEAVDVLLSLAADRRNEILSLLEGDTRRDIDHLLSHAKTPIGELMTTEFLTVRPHQQIKEVFKQIVAETEDFEQLHYIYVLNNNDQLVGVCNLHELLLHPSDTPLYKFMIPDVVAIHLYTPEEIAITKMLKYKINALPVVNEEKKLLGILTLDDIAEFILEKL